MVVYHDLSANMTYYVSTTFYWANGLVYTTPKYKYTTGKHLQPIRTRYLGHVTGYQPIRGQYFLNYFPSLVSARSSNCNYNSELRSNIESQPVDAEGNPTKTVVVEVPIADFSFSSYNVLVVKRDHEYIGGLGNVIFRYTTEYKKSLNSTTVSKRDTTEPIYVWIYSSSEALQDSGRNLGAFYAGTLDKSGVSGLTATLDYSEYGFVGDAEYLIMLNACPDSSSMAEDCYVGEPASVDMPKTYATVTSLAVVFGLIALVIIVLVVVYCIVTKGRFSRRSEVESLNHLHF
eukprot:sb/3467676/